MAYGVNESPYKYFHASTAQTNTVVKSFPGILHSVNVNNIGATGVTITLADAAGTIAVIATPTVVSTLEYDIGFTSLTVSSTGSTAPDFTIAYS